MRSRLGGRKCLVHQKFVGEIYWIHPRPVRAINFFVWYKGFVTFVKRNKLFKYIFLVLKVFLNCFQHWFWVLILRNNMSFLLVFLDKLLNWREVCGGCLLPRDKQWRCAGDWKSCCALGCSLCCCRN